MARFRSLRASPALGRVVRQYHEHLTPRGRYLLWATTAFALVGVDTRRTQVFELFAIAFALLVVALVYAPRIARMARTAAVEIATRDFVTIARLRGETSWSVMRRELLPNATGAATPATREQLV